MKILFIYSLDTGILPGGLLEHQRVQLGISYISSLLLAAGHRTQLAVLSRLFGARNKIILEKHLRSFRPDMVCFTAIATQYDFIKGIAKYIKQRYPNVYLLIGGAHVSLNPQEAIADDFDALCIGEGEYPTLELVAQLAAGRIPAAIPNLWIKHNSGIERNPPREFIAELDNLPFPDRKMWLKFIGSRSRFSQVLLSRGCNFECSYCCNHRLSKLSAGKYLRWRHPENIIAEIRKILKDFPTVRHIFLESEHIASNQDWCIKLCSCLSQLNAKLKHPLTFASNLRIQPGFDPENVFSALKKCNFAHVNIGLESGSERIRKEILKRDYANRDLIKAVEIARKYGLGVNFFNLIGIPTETIADFKATVGINRICLPDQQITCIFFPYPGTDLYDLCQKLGLLKRPLDPTHERIRAVLDLPDFPLKKIQESLILFNDYVYRGLEPEDKLSFRLKLKLKLMNFFLKYYGALFFLPFLTYPLELVKKCFNIGTVKQRIPKTRPDYS